MDSAFGRCPDDQATSVGSVQKTAVFQAQAPADQVFAALANGLPMVGFKVDWFDPESGRIWASTGRKFTSYGSKLQLLVSAPDPGSSTVDVESSPVVRTTLTDWGRTKRDFARIKQLVETGRPGEPEGGHDPDSFRGVLASLAEPDTIALLGGFLAAALAGWSWWSVLWAPVGWFGTAYVYGKLWSRRKKRRMQRSGS